MAKDEELRYHCHGGLIEVILPIKLDGNTIGSLMVGQIRLGGRPPTDIAAAWTKTHGSSEGILAAWNELEPFDEPKLENMLRLFEMLVQFIVSQNYVTLRQGVLIERILRHVDDRLDQALLLSETARELGVSESAVSHALRNKLGLGFSRLVARKKIERFETILHRDPGLTIQDAAALVGYQDALYFSRLYKRHRLVPPSTFLASVRDSAAGKGPGLLRQVSGQ
jgi:AraC-like DNA-binding protein